MTEQTLDRISDLVARARKAGADAADAVFVRSVAAGAGVRNGVTEELERSETTDLGFVFLLAKRVPFFLPPRRNLHALMR